MKIESATIDRIKELTDIHDLINETTPLKRAGSSFKGLCPFHQESSPSLDVSLERRRYRCFGCGETGDVIEWVMKLRGIDFESACRLLASRAGIYIADSDSEPSKEFRYVPAPRRKRPTERKTPTLQELSAPTDSDFEALASLRSLPLSGLVTAYEKGFLGFLDWDGQRAWIVMDKTKINAQVRTLDGTPALVTREGKAIKARTLTGSWARWPIGSSDIRTPHVMLAEGGPDFLAAICLIDRFDLWGIVSPVALFGASLSIHEKAVPFFRHKIVTVAEHNDEPGRELTKRLALQLEGIASVSGVCMSEGDLNDCYKTIGDIATLALFPYQPQVPF